MKVQLAYGQGYLPVDLPKSQTTVIEPSHTPGLKDEKAAVLQALDNPIGTRPLREWIKPGQRVCITFADITRATPSDRMIPWLLEYLKDVPRESDYPGQPTGDASPEHASGIGEDADT